MRLTAIRRLLQNNYIYVKTISGRHNTSQIIDNLGNIVDSIKGKRKSYFCNRAEQNNLYCEELLYRMTLHKCDNIVLDETYLNSLFQTYDGIKKLRQIGFISKDMFDDKSSSYIDNDSKFEIKNNYQDFMQNTALPSDLVTNYYKNSIKSKNKINELFTNSKLCLFYFNASKTKICVCIWKVQNGVVRYGATMWDKPRDYFSRFPSKNY